MPRLSAVRRRERWTAGHYDFCMTAAEPDDEPGWFLDFYRSLFQRAGLCT